MKNKPTYLNKDSIEISSNTNAAEITNKFIRNQQPKAIVIGAGPAGLATAIDLRQKGLDVLVIEKRAAFTRSNIIGINRMALPWFQQHGILQDLLANSNVTGSYPSVLPTQDDMLNAKLWLEDSASTTNTIAIKSLQQLLLNKFKSMGTPGNSYLLTNINIQIQNQSTLTINADSELTIDLNDIQLVIVADGSQSQMRERLQTLFADKNSPSLNVLANIPQQQFANIIISSKPRDLKPGVYLHKDQDLGLAMAFSVSENEISLNFQTKQDTLLDNHLIISQLVKEAHAHLQTFLTKMNINEKIDALYYPIHGGKISHGFSNTDIIDTDLAKDMNHIVFATPSTYASQMVYGDKFVLTGDTKGTSSPMAGLGASLALALDPSIVAKYADDLHRMSEQLQNSIATWIRKTIVKLQLKVNLEVEGAALIARQIEVEKPTLINNANRLFSHEESHPGILRSKMSVTHLSITDYR